MQPTFDTGDALVVFAVPKVIHRSGTNAIIAILFRPQLDIDQTGLARFGAREDSKVCVSANGQILVLASGTIHAAEDHEAVANAYVRTLYFELRIRASTLELDDIEEVRALVNTFGGDYMGQST